MIKLYKKIAVLIISVFSLVSACKTREPSGFYTSSPAEVEVSQQQGDFPQQSTWVLGYFTRERMTIPPHSEWYFRGYNEYIPDSEVINKLKGISKEGLSITIVLGTWCPDSRREVPRFMKILDIWNFPVTDVTFIGVDDMKKSPIGDFEKLDIQRVPTFILYRKNIEAGRIIENHVTSLEQDIGNILSKE